MNSASENDNTRTGNPKIISEVYNSEERMEYTPRSWSKVLNSCCDLGKLGYPYRAGNAVQRTPIENREQIVDATAANTNHANLLLEN
ncbi:hypothetical protein F2Q68_00019192 [Brassica cretica]|uniref:Uncharacterized protein n=2 Tax=Brassica cretica TaxID=69181 RepID=A0A8S9FWV9_BRACR|nr:hypothetical protein F2Q68_00019192 [Brassica cretica]KAF3561770.1 hypothetical protein DY000_02011909 [Brassica cretica]